MSTVGGIMSEATLHAPRLLLYHDLTEGGGVPPSVAAARFARQLDSVRGAGFRFATLDDCLAGRLGRRDVVVTFDDALRSFAEVALPALSSRGIRPALFAVSSFADRVDARDLFLGWEELRACAAAGVHVGCHAATHVPLDEIPAEAMRREIADSTRRMREEGLDPVTFAYPFGRYDDGVKAALAEEGYRVAFTVMKGGADDLEVRRRLLTGAEGRAALRLVLSDSFFGLREAARSLVPDRLLKQDRPIEPERWGAPGFGLAEIP